MRIMFALVSVTVLSLARIVAAQTCMKCDDVHFFLARGNNEPYPGRQGELVAATCDGVSSCGYEDLIYSALYTDLSCQTTYDGAIAGHIQMTAYAERCPDSKLVLAGYSQGGQIAGDILGGGGGESFNGCIQPETPPLDRSTSPGSKIAAVIIFGDTRHTADQPYNFGNGSSYDGLFPRPQSQVSALEAYANVMRNWCLEPDPICAGNNSNSDVMVHLNYYNNYSSDAASWLHSVASITPDSDFTTVIPTQVSGTAQNYATVGTATPSGTVTTHPITSDIVCSSTTSSRSTAVLAATTNSAQTSGERSAIASRVEAAETASSASAVGASASASTASDGAASIVEPVGGVIAVGLSAFVGIFCVYV